MPLGLLEIPDSVWLIEPGQLGKVIVLGSVLGPSRVCPQLVYVKLGW